MHMHLYTASNVLVRPIYSFCHRRSVFYFTWKLKYVFKYLTKSVYNLKYDVHTRSAPKVSSQPCNMKERDICWRRYKIQEILYTGQWCLSPLQSRHLGTPQFSQSPSAARSYFPESHWQSKISSLSKVIFILGKTRSRRTPNLGCSGAESAGWFDVSPKNSAQDVMHEQVCCCDEAANHQLPIAAAFWIIWIASVEECSSLAQNWMQIPCSSCSVILNMTATQYTCSLHWLVQWSRHYSRMHIPVHSPWLPGYIDVTQIFLVILTMAGYFPDTPYIYTS